MKRMYLSIISILSCIVLYAQYDLNYIYNMQRVYNQQLQEITNNGIQRLTEVINNEMKSDFDKKKIDKYIIVCNSDNKIQLGMKLTWPSMYKFYLFYEKNGVFIDITNTCEIYLSSTYFFTKVPMGVTLYLSMDTKCTNRKRLFKVPSRYDYDSDTFEELLNNQIYYRSKFEELEMACLEARVKVAQMSNESQRSRNSIEYDLDKANRLLQSMEKNQSRDKSSVNQSHYDTMIQKQKQLIRDLKSELKY